MKKDDYPCQETNLDFVPVRRSIYQFSIDKSEHKDFRNPCDQRKKSGIERQSRYRWWLEREWIENRGYVRQNREANRYRKVDGYERGHRNPGWSPKYMRFIYNRIPQKLYASKVVRYGMKKKARPSLTRSNMLLRKEYGRVTSKFPVGDTDQILRDTLRHYTRYYWDNVNLIRKKRYVRYIRCGNPGRRKYKGCDPNQKEVCRTTLTERERTDGEWYVHGELGRRTKRQRKYRLRLNRWEKIMKGNLERRQREVSRNIQELRTRLTKRTYGQLIFMEYLKKMYPTRLDGMERLVSERHWNYQEEREKAHQKRKRRYPKVIDPLEPRFQKDTQYAQFRRLCTVSRELGALALPHGNSSIEWVNGLNVIESAFPNSIEMEEDGSIYTSARSKMTQYFILHHWSRKKSRMVLETKEAWKWMGYPTRIQRKCHPDWISEETLSAQVRNLEQEWTRNQVRKSEESLVRRQSDVERSEKVIWNLGNQRKGLGRKSDGRSNEVKESVRRPIPEERNFVQRENNEGGRECRDGMHRIEEVFRPLWSKDRGNPNRVSFPTLDGNSVTILLENPSERLKGNQSIRYPWWKKVRRDTVETPVRYATEEEGRGWKHGVLGKKKKRDRSPDRSGQRSWIRKGDKREKRWRKSGCVTDRKCIPWRKESGSDRKLRCLT
jgi:hypothetical protein